MAGPPTGPVSGATDAEDDPDPTAGCTPAAGSVLPLGTTSVTCSVIDRGGLPASATFDVTVVDTTRPTLLDMPGDQSLTTGKSTGATLAYTLPSATDVVGRQPGGRMSPCERIPSRTGHDHGDVHRH